MDLYGDNPPPRKRVRVEDYFTATENKTANEIFQVSFEPSVKSKRDRKREKVYGICKVFQRQQSAIDELTKIFRENLWVEFTSPSYQPRIFAFEWCENLYVHLMQYCSNLDDVFDNPDFRQSRYFLLCSYKSFWLLYSQLPENSKHFYEVLLFRNPVNLYFDLEGPPRTIREGLETMGVFRMELEKELKRKFGDCVSLPFSTGIVDLASSTDRKFSHHVIVKPVLNDVQTLMFKSIDDCGRFVKNWVAKMKKESENNAWSKLLFYEVETVANEKRLKSIIDTLVYTRNRNFRIVGSSKKGKRRKLEYVGQYRDAEDIFLASQVCHIDPESYGLSCPFENCSYLKIQSKMPSERKIQTNERMNNSESTFAMSTQPERITHDRNFVALKKFFIKEVSKNGRNPPVIRSMQFFPSTQLVVIYVVENRFCYRINREHASNNVYYNVYLSSRVMLQKCTDPECRNWRSHRIYIPKTVELPI